MNAISTAGAVVITTMMTIPMAYAADLAERFTARKTVPGQCHGFFGQPITDDKLSDMHDAGCCDVLINMEETAATNALERRLHCDGWHHYVGLYGVPPASFEDLASGDPEPPTVIPATALVPAARPTTTVPMTALTPASPPIVIVSTTPRVVAAPVGVVARPAGTDGVSLPPAPSGVVQVAPGVQGPQPALEPQ